MAFDGAGGVRAMVGGASYRHSPYNRAVRAQRQPGSAFKPFVYLAAMQAGYTPWDVFVDEPIDIDGWQPGNFTNTYLGAVTLEKALALSINTVAARLHDNIGREAAVRVAANMGMKGFRPYASLALGAQETNLYALTAAYVPFANWGYTIQPHGLEAIYSVNGEVLYTREPAVKTQVLDTKILGQMNTMLRTVVQSGTGKSARIEGFDVAGKTGTTNDYRDAWFVGYAPDYVAGVWVGNDDNSKMSRVTGGAIPARIWKEFMGATLAQRSGHQQALRLPAATRPVVTIKHKSKDTLSLEKILADLERGLP